MIDREYWELRPDWLDYVKSVWKGNGRVEQIKEQTLESLSFRDRAAQAFEQRGVPIQSIKTWVCVQAPCLGEGYDEGYPHTHEPKHATTLVHYLDPGDQPAPLDIFNGDEVVETIYPEPGLTVFMPNSLLHGVRKNHGTQKRYAMIATAL